MSSRQTVCENCVSVCQVPKSLSRDAVISIFKSGLHGRVTDLVTVARTEQDRNLTRWIVWLESTEDVRYLLESLKEDRIEVEENVFTVTYKRTDACDIPNKWLQVAVEYEQQHASDELRSSLRSLGHETFPQHGEMASKMITNTPLRIHPVSYLDMRPFPMPGEYNVPFAGKMKPQFTNLQEGYPTPGYPLSSMQSDQPGPTEDDVLKHLADTDDEDELDRNDKDDIYHEIEHCTQEVEERPTRILVSNLPPSAHEEYLEMYFESPKRFGVLVKNVELDEETNSAVVEFDDPDGVDAVLGKRPVKMMGQVVDIEVCTPEPLCTIRVKGHPSIMHPETLELYFDNEKKSNGGNVQNIEYDSEEDVFYVSFETEEIAQRVLEKPDHTICKKNLHVQLCKSKGNKKKLQNKANKYKRAAEDISKVQKPVCSVKVKGVKALPSRTTFELYFENQKWSGGGDIEDIQTDEEDDDIVYIKYKSEQVARTVADRSHVLEECELDVSLYVPPEPLPSYENKVLIKGLNPKTTQDCLFIFIEAKSGFAPESMIRHTQKEDVVMLTMEESRDFTLEKFEKIFANARLEGNTLKFARVPITDCIIVYNLSDDMEAETIRYYFENKRRSGGGPVRKVVMNDDNTCFVYFTDFKTIDSVLERQHILGKEVLLVQKYQECIARPEGEVIQRKLNIPAPLILKNVDPEKIIFINNSYIHKKRISFELEKVHAHIIWQKKPGHVQLDCTLTTDDKNCFKIVKTWKTEALRTFEDLMKNIVVHKIDVLQGIWQAVFEKLKNVSVSKPEDAAVFVEKKLGMITVVGKKTTVDEIARRVNEIKKYAMAELEKERHTENVNGKWPVSWAIDSVLERQHILGKEVLLVQKYQECIARPEGEVIQRKLNIPAPLILKNVDPEKIIFINNSYIHKKRISFELEKVHAHIIWQKKTWTCSA